MHITVDDVVDHEDGSATFTITMDYDTLINFARQGFIAALRESAEEIIKNQETEE
jgi:hypothetical protein